MKTNSRSRLVTAIRWVGRALAAGVFLFWGGFFVEHLQEWFIRPFPDHPPLKVCAAMALHFLILAGLIAALRWELAGGALVMAASFAFLYGRAGPRFPALFGMTVLPAVLLLACRWQEWKTLPQAAAENRPPPKL